MASDWPMVSLGEVILPVERPEVPIPGTMYRQIGVRLWGQGAYEREPIDGSQTKYKTLSRVEADDIIVNKIWARNGSVAVVPENLAGCYGSSEFPTFAPIREELEPRWFHWFTKTKDLWEQCDAKSRGTSGKNRIRPERFLGVEIPLPPLDEQRRIVARVEELAALIEEARGLRVKAREEAEALQKSMLQGVFSEKMGQPNDWLTLSTIVERIENGWSPVCLPYPADEDKWGVLKVGAVSTGQFVPNENKALPPHLEPRSEFEIGHGDFLFGRANTRELVGACTVVKNPRKRLLLCDKIFRFVFKPNVQLDKFYLNFALKSPPLREQIEAVASGTSSSMKNISKAKVMKLRVPLPPLDEQRRIVAYLDNLQDQVDELTTLQEATQAELDALLPSVLDRAFRGEL